MRHITDIRFMKHYRLMFRILHLVPSVWDHVMMLKVPMQPFPLILLKPTLQPTRRKLVGSVITFISTRKDVDGIHRSIMAIC